MFQKKQTNKILNSIRAKFTKKTIIVLILITILVIPTIITENENIPKSNENLFYIMQCRNGGALFTNNSTQVNYSYRDALILNGTLYPQPHIGLHIHINVKVCQDHAVFKSEDFNITRFTNSKGVVNLSLSDVINMNNLTKGLANNTGYTSATSVSCSIENKYLRGNDPERLVCTHIICDPFVNSSSNEPYRITGKKLFNGTQTAQLYFDDLPFPQLGYYGITPVFYLKGNFTKNVNIGYTAYNSADNVINRSNMTLTSLGVGDVYIDRNYTQLKAFNEARNVIFYANGNQLEFSLFGGFGRNVFHLPQNQKFLVFFTPSEIAILIGLFMALVLFSPMYGEDVYRKYLSLPQKRSKTLLIELFSSFIIGSIFVGIGAALTYLLYPAIGSGYISLYAILFIYLIFASSLVLMISLFSIIGAYFIGRSRPIIFLSLVVGSGYIILRYIADNLLVSAAYYTDLRFLYKPVLNMLRNYDIISSVSPIFDIKEMNDYLTHTIFLNRNIAYATPVIYNHLNIFDLSPILFLSSMICYVVLFLFLGIRKYKRI